jgi:hypothetical protein
MPIPRLPYRPKPQPDELLSSWIVRTAAGMSMRLHTFTNGLWPGREVWTRDVDWFSDPALVVGMAEATDTPIGLASATVLRAFEGHLFPCHRPNARTAWIRPLSIFHRLRLSPGMQFCPTCLKSDRAPYFRRLWRLAFITACPVHGCVLLERCPECNCPINFHRVAPGSVITSCWRCGYDLAEVRAPRAYPAATAFQLHLEHVLGTGQAQLGRYGSIYSVRFFAILRQIARIIATGRAAQHLQRAMAELEGLRLELTPTRDGLNIERLPPMDRHLLLLGACYLIDSWPNRLVEICHATKTWSSDVLRDMDDIPFALADPTAEHLLRVAYVPSVEEVDAAADHLRRRGFIPTTTRLRRLLELDSKVFRESSRLRAARAEGSRGRLSRGRA